MVSKQRLVLGVAGITGLVAITLSQLFSAGHDGLSSDRLRSAENRQVRTITWLLNETRVARVPVRNLFAQQDAEDEERDRPTKIAKINKPQPAPVTVKPVIRQPPKLLGIALHDGKSRAFFIDNGKLIIARPGDRIKRYRIRRIRERQVDISNLDNGLKQTIYLK